MKKRRTKVEKIKSAGFHINLGKVGENKIIQQSFLRSDLTKVGILTMLALALELLLYWKLKP